MKALSPLHPEAVPEDRPATALAAGTRLLDYEIIGTVGEGAMGIVYLASDRVSRQRVAIKEYLPAALAWRSSTSQLVVPKAREHAENFRQGLRTFMYEARLLARLDHPALIKVLRFWELNGTAYMAMPFQEGPTLASVLDTLERPASEEAVRAWLTPLLDALAGLHAVGCCHRGVAADNIRITPQGPLLLDLGAAAPQQAPSDDLYALAAIACAAIAGQPPAGLAARVAGEAFTPLSALAADHYSASLLQAIDKALALQPEDRPQTVAAFRQLLEPAEAAKQVAATPPSVLAGEGDAGQPAAQLPVPALAADAPAQAPSGGDDWSNRVREFMGEVGETPVEDGWWQPAPDPEDLASPTATAMDADADADAAAPVDVQAASTSPASSPPAASSSRRRPVVAAAAVALLAFVALLGYRFTNDSSSPPASALTAAQPPQNATAIALPAAPAPAPTPTPTPTPAPTPTPTPLELTPVAPSAIATIQAPDPAVAAPTLPFPPAVPAAPAATAKPTVSAAAPPRPSKATATPPSATASAPRAKRPTPQRSATVAATPPVPGKPTRTRCRDLVQRASIEPVTTGQAFRLKEECQK